MQFHHHGYVSGDPRVSPVDPGAPVAPEELPDEVDVLIVGAGPAGMILAAQLAQFPDITARVIDRRPGRLEVGQADGIQARSVETFEAFGFAGRITAEAYQISSMNFWAPDPAEPGRIVRSSRAVDDPTGISEYPHLIVNQARVLDYFAESMANAPARLTPDYGYRMVDLRVEDGAERPAVVTLESTSGADAGETRAVRAGYVVGCDGARSAVRDAMGLRLEGTQAMHAWAVIDALAVTDFPDIRTKCAIQSNHGSILLIPREGGFLFRMYVDLGDLAADDAHQVRDTSVEEAVRRANEILSPYTLDVRDVAWFSVYEVGHRIAARFDDSEERVDGVPRVFIAGDACHTHSAKAGQGMNVSMQDGFNLGWKLASVLRGQAPRELLATYAAERHTIAQNLIDFDREWSSMMAASQDDGADPEALAEFYTRTAEFPAGFMTCYPPSMIVGEATHQDLAARVSVGKRFRSWPVRRVFDTTPQHLGHHAKADGRWRIYAFADRSGEGLRDWAERMLDGPGAVVPRFTPEHADLDAVLDVKAVYQQPYDEVDLEAVPRLLMPTVGPFGLIDYEKAYAADPADDVFDALGISRDGCVVVVRPDQYVAHVLPLDAVDAVSAFLDQHMIPAPSTAPFPHHGLDHRTRVAATKE